MDLDGAKIAKVWSAGVERQIGDLRQVPRPRLGDLLGGVSVALVLIPQSIANASLAGLPPVVGLFAAAFPLLVFALFASSPYLQTGPVALTSLLTAGALIGAGFDPGTTEYIAAAGLLAIIVGVTRLIIGATRLGSVVYLMAEPVTIGFTSGAGLVILSSQLSKALGATLPANVAAQDNPIVRALWTVANPGEWRLSAILFSVVTLAFMLGGKRVHRLFPGVLIAVIATLAFSRIVGYEGPIIDPIPSGLPSLNLSLPWGSIGSLLTGGLVIALIGFAEPASIARAFASESQTRWSSSREFVASGFANLVAGATGAYPVGGSFARSSVNKIAGAETRWSGAITAVVVLAFLPFAFVLDGLPDAVLGAVVIGAVISLIKPRRLWRFRTRSPYQAALVYLTLIATLISPPNIHYAVLFGIAVTLILHFVRPFSLEVLSNENDELELRPWGLLWVGTNTRFSKRLNEVIEADPGHGPVTVSLDRSTAIDAATAASLVSAQATAQRSGREFAVRNAPRGAEVILSGLGVPVIYENPPEPQK